MKTRTGTELVSLLLLTVLGNTENARDRGSWGKTWACEKDKCVSSAVVGSRATSRPSSLLCSLTCGQEGALWPRPTDVALSSELVEFDPRRITFDLSGLSGGDDSKNTAKQMTEIFLGNIVKECPNSVNVDPETEVVISLVTSSPSLTLNMETNETYSLQLASEASRVTVSIRSVTVYGARHGLETLSQLIGCPAQSGDPLMIVSKARVRDMPVYRHRGLMLDTARNYLPVKAIKRTLDGMAASKLNVLHWHATDSQSFPLYLPRVPELARYGAYSPDKVYTAETILQIIEYARVRGIRVIIEFDAPSHAGNGWQWGESAGLGSLAVCVNQYPWKNICIQPPCGQLNPTNTQLYKVLRELYSDLVNVMAPEEILHMGGDEVYFPCWNSSDEIVNWMATEGLGRSQEDFIQLWGQYQAAVLRILDDKRGHSKTPTILWSSHLTDPKRIEKYLDKDRYIIQTWVESSNPLPDDLLSKGYRLIISTKNTWYLDHGFWGSTAYHNWRVAYSNRIPRSKGVLGGEACMWGELVDENSLDTKVWPRAAAVAERLWSDPTGNTNAAEQRMYEHRERLVRRGIMADALGPEWCHQNEGQC